MDQATIPEQLDRLFGGRPPAPDFMGITVDRARSRAATKGIPIRVLVVDPDRPVEQALTLDLRPDRLNVVVAHGVVVRAGYF
jgi:hypothetical protein